MSDYDPLKLEPKWQKKWLEEKIYRAEDSSNKPKYYALVEFPYPSGSGLHMGHAFTYALNDVLARKKRMDGYNVLCPMGWDAFGLPTENYAIKTGIHPVEVTKKNTAIFKEQDLSLGMSFDWEREINTSDPDYYKWTQWIFLQIYKKGLAYKAETPVGWCPSCKSILANEEIVSGNCERCGTQAEYKRQSQWLLKITAYADRLADELDLVDYPDHVKVSQRNWIGKTKGINIEYPVVDSDLLISCYSTRPDTNFGATFVVIAPEHPLVEKLTTAENKESVSEYIKKAQKKSEMERTDLAKEKTGVFTGSYALNRLNNKKMPIYVSDFVVLTAGTGIVVGVPAHDDRDFAFAQKFHLEIIPVIKSKKGDWDFSKRPLTDIDDALVFNSDFLNDLPVKEAIEKVINYLEEKGWGERAVNYHLRDWIFSRQHYWGEPIPVVFCPSCAKTTQSSDIRYQISEFDGVDYAIVPVPEDQLPVKLPEVEKYQPTDTGESPLANIKAWVNTTCPKCGGSAKRETDTMPQWAGSSWYYLRFCDPKNQNQLASNKLLSYWMPVDIYMGGAEHTTLHLLYSRFWHKVLNDLDLVPGKEPYAARRQHGVILGEDGFKMSKSRGNVINPTEMVEKIGADALRLYLLFMGPYETTMPWDTKGTEGTVRFLNRVWKLSQKNLSAQTSRPLSQALNKVIKKVGEDIDNLKFNTAIAAMMGFINAWQEDKNGLSKEDLKKFILILAPFAPHMAEELWQRVEVPQESRVSHVPQGLRELKARGTRGTSNSRDTFISVHQQSWPTYDKDLLVEEEVVIAVQVNGKLRGQIRMQNSECRIQNKVEEMAKKEESVSKFLTGEPKKVIFIPGKLINFVV